MKQYLNILKTIKEQGTHKPAARENMPGSLSLFGHQERFNLQEGFPAMTTKKLYWKGVVVELIWFLRGDTNIKYLVDNGLHVWDEDAYQYYLKKCKQQDILHPMTLEEFVNLIQSVRTYGELSGVTSPFIPVGYILGDCGYQYGRVWRNLMKPRMYYHEDFPEVAMVDGYEFIDQVQNVLKSLREAPEGRRHIITAVDPYNDKDLALYWCHSLFQFNCRPLTQAQRGDWVVENGKHVGQGMYVASGSAPKYFLDCQLYQRSADVFLGVPFNIASYALLTHLFAEITGMAIGHFVHTFGDVHIYDNHVDAVNEQLTREPKTLPRLKLSDKVKTSIANYRKNPTLTGFNSMVLSWKPEDFVLENYEYHPAIKAELSTGLRK